MHSPRISEQMSRADNVIVAQGEGAVRALARMIRSWQSPGVDQIKGYRDAYKDIAKNAAAQLEEAKAEIARLKAAFTRP